MEINKTINMLKSSISALEKNHTLALSKLTGVTSESKKQALAAIADLKSYFEVDSTDRRSLHLLLLVNTELSISRDLENDTEVGHVVGFISPLSPYFYLLCVVEYNLLVYVEEVMIQAPISLVLEVIAVVSKHSKYLPAYRVAELHEKLLNGIATRITFGQCPSTNRKLFEHFESLMLYYKYSPSEDVKADEETLKLAGFKIYSLLKILRHLLKLSFNLIEPVEPIEVYKMSLTTDVSRWYSDLTEKNDLLECLEVAYYKCKAFFNELDILMFVAWHEVKLEGRTLQTAIGEEAYYVNQFLKNNPDSQNLPKGISELSEMLPAVVCEPAVKCEEEFIEKLSVERLEELIFEKEIDCKLLSSVKRFLNEDIDNKFEFVISIKIVHKLCSEKKLQEIAAEDVREVILTLLRKSELNEMTSFLNDFLSEYGFSSILYKSTVDLSDVIKNLNLCYGGDDEEDDSKDEELTVKKKEETLKEGVLLSYQSPEFVLSTFIEQCVLETNQKNGLMEMIKVLKPLCLYVPPAGDDSTAHPLLIKVMERFLCCSYSKLSPSENQIFNELVIFLSNEGLIIDNDQFLSQCLLPLLNLKNEINWELTTNLLKLFNEFYVTCVKESKLSTVIILAQLAQLLEQSRWSIETFSTERLTACEEIINLTELFMKVYSLNPGPEKDKHWLSMQLRRFSYLTKSYFPYIYEENESNNVESLFLSLKHTCSTEFDKHANDSSNVILPISKVLINLTPKEMQNIVANYSSGSDERIFSMLILISDAVAFVCGSAAQFTAFLSGDNHPIFSCMGHLINTYLSVLQVNINKECKSSEDQASYIKCVNRVAITLKSFPKHLLRTYQFNVLKIVNEILPKLKENSSDLDGDTRQLLLGLFLF